MWIRLVDFHAPFNGGISFDPAYPREDFGKKYQGTLKGAHTVVNDELWLIGGYHCGNWGVHQTTIMALDLKTNSWREVCEMPPEACKIERLSVGCIGGIVIMAGGLNRHNATANAWHLNSAEAKRGEHKAWKKISPLPHAVISASSFVHGNRFYVLGGYTLASAGQAFPESDDKKWTGHVQMYDFGTQTWSLKAEMPRRAFCRRTIASDSTNYSYGGLVDGRWVFVEDSSLLQYVSLQRLVK